MSEYQMKKALRRTPGAPKSYAQLQEQLQINFATDKLEREKQSARESIFEHKNWTLKEKVKLMVFFSFYQVLTDWQSERRSIYLYKHLSNFLKRTRTPEQCKNIHSLLKRKFSCIQEIINNMMLQLQHEDHYQKCLMKYEREIVNFEKEHELFNSLYGEHQYLPISSRKVTQREEPIEELTPLPIMSQNLHVKCQQGSNQPLSLRENLINACSFHFQEWYMYANLLEQRRAKRGDEVIQ